MDFDATRRLLEREITAETEYLGGIQDLDSQAKNVKALHKALRELTKAPSTTGQLKQLQAFVTGVKTEIDRLDCADLKKALDQATEKKKSLDAKRKPLEATPALQEKNQLEIEKLGKQIGVQDSSIKDLTGQRTERACTN
jgi:antitoxin component HigA of HigAB toxin-antitoxin module